MIILLTWTSDRTHTKVVGRCLEAEDLEGDHGHKNSPNGWEWGSGGGEREGGGSCIFPRLTTDVIPSFQCFSNHKNSLCIPPQCINKGPGGAYTTHPLPVARGL